MERSIMTFERTSKIQPYPCPGAYRVEGVRSPDLLLATLYYESYRHTIDDEGESVADWQKELNEAVHSKYGVLLTDISYTLFYGQKLAGCILCSEYRGVPLIIYIVIHPNHRGRHLSKVLLSKTLQTSRLKGLSSVYLVVTNENKKACRIYKEIGFKVAGNNWDHVLKEQ